jgi:hypothetical protein
VKFNRKTGEDWMFKQDLRNSLGEGEGGYAEQRSVWPSGRMMIVKMWVRKWQGEHENVETPPKRTRNRDGD